MIGLFVRHPNAANLLMALLIAVGLVAATRLNRQFLPTIGFDIITVSMTWPGASAADIESALIERIEPEVRTLAGVDSVTATAREGTGSIVLSYVDGSDMQTALSDVESAVSRLTGLPEDIDELVIQRVTRYEPVARLVLSGPMSEAALAAWSRQIRNDLLARGLDRVVYAGRRDPEIRVALDEATLRRLDLTVEEVGQRIAAASLDAPLGDFGAAAEVQARVATRADHAADLAQVVVIPDPAGGGTRLAEIARLADDVDRDQPVVRFNGRRAVELVVERVEATDSLDAHAAITAYLDEMRPTWPPDLEVAVFEVLADPVRERIDLLIRNGIGGLVIVLALLVIFLESRVTFWIAVGIPVALCATAGVMLALGQTINMVSMFGLILSLGIVVDDAIVVGEHAAHLRAGGMAPALAAETAARRMAVPVFAASLTTVASFLPILMLGDVIGQIVTAIPMVVAAVLVASLVECFLILPSHMRDALAAGARRPPSQLRQRFDRAFDRFRHGVFRRWMVRCLAWRHTTIAALVAGLVLALGLIAGGRVGFVFFTGPEGDNVVATVAFVPGTPRETTLEMMARMTAALERAEAALSDGAGGLVRTALIKLGEDDHQGEILVELVASDRRDVRTSAVMAAWRAEIAPMPGLETLTVRERRGGPPGRDIDIRLSGADADTLKRAAIEIAELVRSFAGVSAVSDDLPYGKAEAQLSLTPLGHSLGFTHQMVAAQLRNAFEGLIVDRFARGEDEVKVRVVLSDRDREGDALADLRLKSPEGGEAALADIVTITWSVGFAEINREDGVREVALTGDVDDAVANPGEIRTALPARGLDAIAARYGIAYRFAGRAEEQADTFADMTVGAVLGLIGIYITLAWALGSYSRPLLVMSIIPFGLMGAIVGHLVMGFDLTILSMVSLLGLAGILVNDSVILMTTIDRRISEGSAPREAVIDGAVERLRPVILTSVTTIGGLLPLLFETSLQAQFLQPMVVTLIFGLATASVLVLLLVPALVVALEDLGVRHRVAIVHAA